MRSRDHAIALALAALFWASPSWSHEVRPGYLGIHQTGPEHFEVRFKVPARGDMKLGLAAHLPETCQELGPRRGALHGGAYSETWAVRCTGGLVGQRLAIDGLSGTLTDVLVRVQLQDGRTQSALLAPSSPTFDVTAAPDWTSVAGTYLELGVWHILGGIDHLLFVLALLILVSGWRRLVATVTAFTAAHSITLALATLGFVHVPSAPVEAVIALSILFLASEIVHARRGRPGVAERRPWIVAFAFGLLHGFGFAGALTEVGLPETAIPLALLLFNVGVEVGQLAFVASVLTLTAAAKRVSVPNWTHGEWAWRLPTYAIGAMAAVWTLERVASFWS